MLHQMIRGLLLKGFSSKPPRFTTPEYTAQFQASTDILNTMQADILATVPQHLGYVSSKNSSTSSTHAEMFLQNNPALRLSSPYFLMWPLWLVGVMDFATEEVVDFVLKNLRTMGKVMGIRQAMVLADILESKSGITVW